jgi:3-oxoacyl-[acyl-carrier protein] reductase
MKNILITGSTKGIGKAIAESFLKEGYFVILNYSSDIDSAKKTVEEFSQKYGSDKLTCVPADLSSINNLDSFIEKVSNLIDRLDVIIINHGITDKTTFKEISVDNWEKVFVTNLTLPCFLIQRLLNKINPGGSVIFTGSLMGIEPHSLSLAYGVSKAAVHALVSNLVKFLAPYNIRINAVAPGFIETDWQKNKPLEIRKSIINKVSMNSFGDVSDVAEAYLFLVKNKYINGQIILVDGGYGYK